jgi:hypothetical protein
MICLFPQGEQALRQFVFSTPIRLTRLGRVVVRRGDPAHGQLRFGSIGPFYAESVLRRVFPL